jgi:hypothetical protein
VIPRLQLPKGNRLSAETTGILRIWWMLDRECCLVQVASNLGLLLQAKSPHAPGLPSTDHQGTGDQ